MSLGGNGLIERKGFKMTNVQTVSYVQFGKILFHQSTVLMFYADFTDNVITYVSTVTNIPRKVFQQEVSIYRNKFEGNRVQITPKKKKKKTNKQISASRVKNGQICETGSHIM
jgi:hypothetical protein